MDNSDEKSIVKWGKIGASLHRSSKTQAIGGRPPYLMPYFGMFGYGGPMASMHLGRRAIVSSKTKESRKVYTLHLEREALLSSTHSELTWRTKGSMRNPTDDENRESRQGSFTKVEILELRVKNMDIFQLQCRLKDIYFPYIQCDDLSNKGKTTTPITFQVNGVDLAEIEGGEVSITNFHSCNGPEFVLQLHFSINQDDIGLKPGLRSPREANACLKCVYFPIVEGKESIEKILEKLEAGGCGIAENFETFSRVSIRRLGRLLPDARWASLPFMESRQKKGDKAYLLKRCCSRVKCYVETDAGFNPTPSKTDLAHHNPFTIALKNLGRKMFEKEKVINVEISRNGKLITPLQLEKEYQAWVLQMHDHYDEEVGYGEDDPILIVSPTNKKHLGISSDVVRVYQILKRKGASWKRGQKIKVLKGACPGLYKSNVYATLEYFLIEGFEGDAGGEARIICRPLDVEDEDGCVLELKNGIASFDIRRSLSLPFSVVDSGKCMAIERIEWNNQLEKRRLRAPSTIDLLDAEHCRELEVGGALPFDATVDVGQVPPLEVVAVVRPASYDASSTSNSLDQKYIFKDTTEMSMVVTFRRAAKGCGSADHIYSKRVAPSCHKGLNGLYIFPLGQKFPKLFRRPGVYRFLFSLVGSSCKECEKNVVVRADAAKWKLLSNNGHRPYVVRVGSTLQPITIACFDKYGNQIPIVSPPEIRVILKLRGSHAQIDKVKTRLSSDKLMLEVMDLLIESSELDKVRPSYEAILLIFLQDEQDPLSIPCKVTPGSLDHVRPRPPFPENQLFPGFVFKELILEMFDVYGNHVAKDVEVKLNTDGFYILDQIGSSRKVDDNGCIDLSGLVKVTAGFGKTVSISISSSNKIVFKLEFQTGKRELRIASKVPDYLAPGSRLENLVFEVVNSEGDVDETIHDEDKYSQSHMLTIKSDSFKLDDCVGYAFRHGRCTVPVVPVPAVEGNFCLTVAHSCYPELHLSIKLSVFQTRNMEYDDVQSPCSHGKLLLLEDSSMQKNVGNTSSLDNAGNLMRSIVKLEKGLEEEIFKYGQRIGRCENQLKELNEFKADHEQRLAELQASAELQLFNNVNYLSTKEEIIEQIKSGRNSAAATICHISGNFSFLETQKLFTLDIIGLVALLGTVHSDKLSRILAEYLGEDQMLAIVCSSYEAASTLEKYKENGEVDCNLAFHSVAAALGKHISGRFLVICLEDIRAYTGEVDESDPQRRLALPDPILCSGNTPSGFIGYAVNMINLDVHRLRFKTRSGNGLRETLFYRLFGELQVYGTRQHMIEARASIKHGAVSLDGGILRENGIISLGYGNPEICFPVEMRDEVGSPRSIEIKKQMEEKERNLQIIESQIEKSNRNREKALKKFRKKYEQYNKFIDHMEPALQVYRCDNS
ncbi:structural maintenance of chromosomes flexible hinge domain-containing protein GMI1 isoform X2 [Manihot esculenta]|nr:structural maintenance of chromosomes flexible hinge domain-containing protein GMI1 isoform X2 [Manihot esculenta]XP_043816107.1 structural maintenance of chromosomes flexible hinge domain-containing protein GMI1 isoform X2 [Manihot esculenta]